MHTTTALAPRLARGARGADRRSALADAFEEVLAAEEAAALDSFGYAPASDDPFVSWAEEEAEAARLASSPCGGWCRRCLLHDDPGGCVG